MHLKSKHIIKKINYQIMIEDGHMKFLVSIKQKQVWILKQSGDHLDHFPLILYEYHLDQKNKVLKHFCASREYKEREWLQNLEKYFHLLFLFPRILFNKFGENMFNWLLLMLQFTLLELHANLEDFRHGYPLTRSYLISFLFKLLGYNCCFWKQYYFGLVSSIS